MSERYRPLHHPWSYDVDMLLARMYLLDLEELELRWNVEMGPAMSMHWRQRLPVIAQEGLDMLHANRTSVKVA